MPNTTDSRPFAWGDVPRLYNLVAQRWSVDGPQAQMHIGDLYWILRGTPEDDLLRHLRVWPRGDGSLAAFALLDPPDAAEIIVAPGAETMFDGALDWLEGEHRGAGAGDLSIVVLAGDDERSEALRRRGYARGDTGNVRFWRALTAPPAPAPLPAGYTLRSVATDLNVERRVFVENDSFGAAVTPDLWRTMARRLPQYRSDLDLIAVAPDGAGASACTCWYDEATRCGEFEAVGTSKAHQRMGIGKAVIAEGLRRLHDLGATQAVVQTTIGNVAAIALYKSCGFDLAGEDYRWTKPA